MTAFAAIQYLHIFIFGLLFLASNKLRGVTGLLCVAAVFYSLELPQLQYSSAGMNAFITRFYVDAGACLGVVFCSHFLKNAREYKTAIYQMYILVAMFLMHLAFYGIYEFTIYYIPQTLYDNVSVGLSVLQVALFWWIIRDDIVRKARGLFASSRVHVGCDSVSRSSEKRSKAIQ